MKHPSYGYLTEDEFKRLAESPRHSHRDQELQNVKKEIEARRGKKTRSKKPKTIFMFEGDKLK